MKIPYGLTSTSELQPFFEDSLQKLIYKAEGMVIYFRENAALSKKAGDHFQEERQYTFADLVTRLQEAVSDPTQEENAKLDALATWANDLRLVAAWTITMAKHIRSPQALAYFQKQGNTDWMADFTANLDAAIPEALQQLSTEDREDLRENGFLD